MACATCCKILLVVLNIVFLIVSLAFLAAGGIITFAIDIFIEDIYETAKDEASSVGYTITGSASDLKDFPLLTEIGYALLGIGIVLFVITILGFCGSCCSSCCKCMLLLFAIMLALIMVVEIVIFSLFFVKDSVLHKELKTTVQEKITTDFDESSGNSFSAAIIILHREFDCCGMDGVQDFGNKDHDSCKAAYETVGCYNKLQDEIQDNKVYAGLGAAALLALQLLEIIAAIVVYKDASSKVFPF